MTRVKLETFIDNVGDGIHGTPIYDANGDYYFVNGNNLEKGKIIITKETQRISKDEYEKIKRPLSEKTILLSINGTLGKLAYYKGEKICLGKSACYINVKEGVNKEFVNYILSTKEFKKYMNLVAHGSTIKNFAPNQVLDYEFELGEKVNQDKVAKILSCIDNKIENNNTISAELERLAKTIYDYWFLQFEFPNEEGKPYKSSGGKMVYNEELKREIPEGWQCKTLKDIASLSMKSVFPDNDIEYNHYSIPSFDESKMPVSESGASIASNKYLVPSESVLVSKLNPQFKRIWLIVETQKNAICSTEFLPVKAGETGLFFLYQLLGSDAFSVHLKQKASSSTGSRKRIDPENCMSFQFAFNEKTAKKYNEKISSIILMANKKASENQQLASLRDWLLPMLMNGQITFKEMR